MIRPPWLKLNSEGDDNFLNPKSEILTEYELWMISTGSSSYVSRRCLFRSVPVSRLIAGMFVRVPRSTYTLRAVGFEFCTWPESESLGHSSSLATVRPSFLGSPKFSEGANHFNQVRTAWEVAWFIRNARELECLLSRLKWCKQVLIKSFNSLF